MPPMLMPKVGVVSVSGIQIGPDRSDVMKFVVFQTPPLAPATYTVLPDGSDGSTAIPPMRPAYPFVDVAWAAEAGPTAVHVVADWRFVGSIVKMRNPTVAWSATGSPMLLSGTPFWNVNDQ